MANRIKILSIWVDAIGKNIALKNVNDYIAHGKRPHSIFASNPEKCFSIPKDPQLLETFKTADLLLPDGIGMVWAANMLYGLKLDRLPGAEFIFDICALAAKEGHGIFIYGAKEETNKIVINKLQTQFKNLKIAGRSNGYVRHSEMSRLIDDINTSRAKILFIALGSPKQEKWFAQFSRDLKHVRVCQCIGGALDCIAGNVIRAPEIWQRLSLEWLYRLITQPSRIKRQKVLPLFVLGVLKMKLQCLNR